MTTFDLNLFYNNQDAIPVTKTFLPPITDYFEYLKKIWHRGQLTNHGLLVNELKSKLKRRLNTKNLELVVNGTLALQIAYHALNLKGEVITTPFSYVATTSSLAWEGLTPVFVDIDPDTLNIDANQIEKYITSKTTAIVATHVFGNPCDIELIAKIAKKHNLKVIYDAAHAFGVKYKNKSIFNYGDISIGSLHATKLFHTAEGGILVSKSSEIAKKIYDLHNFGHNGPNDFIEVGINGKMSELHAAMGLSVFPYMDNILKKRKNIFDWYIDNLKVKIRMQKINHNARYNYAYFPTIFENEAKMLRVKKNLESKNIFPRRYFYPSLNKLPYLKYQQVSISEKLSKSILCLPIYYNLKLKTVESICKIINHL